MAILLSTFQLLFLLSNVWTSYKTLKPPPISRRTKAPSSRALAARKRELKSCLAVWIVWATWSFVERFADRTIGFVTPFYTDIKTFFLITLFFTRAIIAEPLLLHLIRPLLKPYVSTIDSILDLLSAIGDLTAHYAMVPWNYLTSATTYDDAPSSPDEGEVSAAVVEKAAPEPEVVYVVPQAPTGIPRPTRPVVPTIFTNVRATLQLPSASTSTVGTRGRRGMQPSQPPSAAPSTHITRAPVQLRLDDSPVVEIPPPSAAPATPHPFIVQAGASSNIHEPVFPIRDSSPPPPYSRTARFQAPAAVPSISVISSPPPRFPGGYAMSVASTETTSEAQSSQSRTVVQPPPDRSVDSFSFPEPPAIEIFAPGSKRSSELPRTRLRTISQMSPAVVPRPALPNASASEPVVPVAVAPAAPAVETSPPAPPPAPLPTITAIPPPIALSPPVSASVAPAPNPSTRIPTSKPRVPEPAPSASSATAAASYSYPYRHPAPPQMPTYAMYEPTLARTYMSQHSQSQSQSKARKPSVASLSDKPQAPSTNPAAAATQKRTVSGGSGSGSAPAPAPAPAPVREVERRTRYAEPTPLSALEPTIATSRWRVPEPFVAPAAAPVPPPAPAPASVPAPAPVAAPVTAPAPVVAKVDAPKVGSSSSASTRSSRSSQSSQRSGIAAGKKRSAKGHVVETPRLPDPPSASASEIDEIATDAAAKKKRKVVTEKAAVPAPPYTAPAAVPAVVVEQVPSRAPSPTALPPPLAAQSKSKAKTKHASQSVARTAALRGAVLAAPQPFVIPTEVSPIDLTMDDSDDDSASASYDNDDSWSAFDELKTPVRKARSLRSRTVFSDDEDGDGDDTLSDHHGPEPVSRPALSLNIPSADEKKPAAPHELSAISEFADSDKKSDAFSSIASVRGVGAGYGRLGKASSDAAPPPIQVSRGRAAAAARGARLRSAGR